MSERTASVQCGIDRKRNSHCTEHAGAQTLNQNSVHGILRNLCGKRKPVGHHVDTNPTTNVMHLAVKRAPATETILWDNVSKTR